MIWIEKDDQKNGLRFDKALEIFDKRFFFECETGSHFYKRENVIRKKIKQYMKLDGRFHVVFVVADHNGISAARYGQEIMNLISEYKRGSQFLVSPYDGIKDDPLGNWIGHPNNKVYSLETIS